VAVCAEKIFCFIFETTNPTIKGKNEIKNTDKELIECHCTCSTSPFPLYREFPASTWSVQADQFNPLP
jgi:hypothetical protein